LADIADRGEALAILWPTESTIYPRIGYGGATHRISVEMATVHAAFAVESHDKNLSARLVEDAGERARISEAVYEAKRRTVPGMMWRNDAFWGRRREDLMGDGAFFVRVADSEGEIRAYASYRVDGGWGDTGPEYHLSVADAISLDSDAERALWQFLLNIDLVTKVSAWHRPVDDPLPYLLHNPRQLRRTLGEGLWLRIIDLPAALSARSYMTEIDVTLNVTDSLLPANSGTWHLQGGPSGATCTPTAEEADLELDTSTLASAFLGHPSLGSPAAAGLVVEHRAGALRQATAAFCWSPAPWAVTWF
jgi:predicted acetyltransferase